MKLTPQEILSRCTDARRRRWASDNRRAQLEDYYNGGEIPNDTCQETQSLGLGNRHLRGPHKMLRSTVEMPDGAVEVIASEVDDFQRSTNIENALTGTLKRWVPKTYRSLVTQVAGEYLIGGKAFAWRWSKRDIKFRCGRPLHESGAGTDIGDDSFWWWAFPYKLTLREIDSLIKVAKSDKENSGWRKESLVALKKWLLTHDRKGEQIESQHVDLGKSFPSERANEPLHCYIYFEKDEEKKGVDRKVNMMIVSRMTEDQAVKRSESLDKDTGLTRPKMNLSLKVREPEEEQLIYKKEGAFDSVHECLISWIEDARISGEQRMDDIGGDGEQFMARLLAMEDMMDSAVAGGAFAMQTHFTADREVNLKLMKRLQENGIKKYGFIPKGVGLADKSNVINSSRAGLELVQALGLSIEEESSTNNLPQAMGQRANTQFAAEANMLADSQQEAVSLRFTFWHAGWDDFHQAVGDTITMVDGWAKADPSYYEVKALHETFEKKGGKLSDFKKATLEFRSRRLPGGSDKNTAVQKLSMILNNPNAPAIYQTWAWDEMVKLMFGNETAHFFDEDKKPDESQVERAVLQSTAALTTLSMIPAERGDDPVIHLQVEIPILQQQIQVVGERGHRTVEDMARIRALAIHIDQDVQNLPGAAREGVAMELQQILAQFASIPEQAPFDEQQRQHQEMQLKAAKTQNDLANGANLREMRQAQLQMKNRDAQFNTLLKTKTAGQQDRRIAVEEAKAQEMQPV